MIVRARLAMSGAILGALGVLGSAGPARADDNACIAAVEASVPLRKADKLHETLKMLATCADPSCPAEVKTECAQRLQEVQRAMPTLSFVLKDQAGADVPGVSVTVDGNALPGAEAGRPLDLDPGEHKVRVEASGLEPLEKLIVVRVGEKDRRETLVLVPPKRPSWWTTQRSLGVASLGLGLVGLAIGGAFAGFVASDKSRESSDCSTARACANYGQSVADFNAASSNGTGSTVSFVLGGVFAAAGVALLVTAPKPAAPAAPTATGLWVRVAPVVAASGGRLSIGGSF